MASGRNWTWAAGNQRHARVQEFQAHGLAPRQTTIGFAHAYLHCSGRERMTAMAEARAQRCTAEIDGDFGVFRIGTGVNRFRKLHKWLPVAAAMPRMRAELARAPQRGLSHARTHSDFQTSWSCNIGAALRIFAARRPIATSHTFRPGRPSTRPSQANGDVGIWNETYLVRAGGYESVYNNMPPFGLGIAGRFGRGCRERPA
jgi:hypothetical protein